MTKKKKVTRGNPAVNNALSGSKPRGGWKPSTSVGSASNASARPQRRAKANWKKALIVTGVVVLAAVFVLTTVLSTVPLFPEEAIPYRAP
jgi:hypothetical protein